MNPEGLSVDRGKRGVSDRIGGKQVYQCEIADCGKLFQRSSPSLVPLVPLSLFPHPFACPALQCKVTDDRARDPTSARRGQGARCRGGITPYLTGQD